ncbi:MAG: acyl-CoA dehydrogenase [Nitratireductor sp.]
MNDKLFEGLEDWIGKTRTTKAVIDARQAELMNATMAGRVSANGICKLRQGAALPHGWHWAWFGEARPASELGRDGHPARGGFMPPIALPRRMWAGSRLQFHQPLRIGMTAIRRTTIASIIPKRGRSGDLVFLTLLHEISEGSTLLVSEEQDLVYRADPSEAAPPTMPQQPPSRASSAISRLVEPDPVWLFRYSALTFNGHRIHYDADYARNVEGYPGIVFHAPLTATLLMDLARESLDVQWLREFSFRAVSPLFVDTPFSIRAVSGETTANIWAETPDGNLAIIADASA